MESEFWKVTCKHRRKVTEWEKLKLHLSIFLLLIDDCAWSNKPTAALLGFKHEYHQRQQLLIKSIKETKPRLFFSLTEFPVTYRSNIDWHSFKQSCVWNNMNVKSKTKTKTNVQKTELKHGIWKQTPNTAVHTTSQWKSRLDVENEK